MVFHDEHSFHHKNQKLAPNWRGLHQITRLKAHHKTEIQQRHNNKKLLVRTNQLKPHLVPEHSIIGLVQDQALENHDQANQTKRSLNKQIMTKPTDPSNLEPVTI